MGVTPSLTGQLRTTAMAPKVKLTYFNLRGRAEPSRLLLAYGGIKYEDCRLTPAFEDPKEWSALKPKTPYGSLLQGRGSDEEARNRDDPSRTLQHREETGVSRRPVPGW